MSLDKIAYWRRWLLYVRQTYIFPAKNCIFGAEYNPVCKIMICVTVLYFVNIKYIQFVNKWQNYIDIQIVCHGILSFDLESIHL